MKYFKIFIIWVYSMCCFLAYAQKSSAVDLSKALQVGDTFVPPKSVKLIRGSESKIDWNALEDKVVLLDFFATTCGTCIQIMPHLQELEKELEGKFKVLVVTVQDKRTMIDFFKKNGYLKEHNVNLPVIHSDDYLKDLFPHLTIPHSVLLYKGKVQAITKDGFVNKENILKLHRQGQITLPLKDDFGKGEMLAKLGDGNIGLTAGVIFSGYQEGVDYQPWQFDQDTLTGLYKSSLYNASMYGALLSLASKAKIKESYVPRFDRVIWKVKDSTKYENFSEQPSDVWLLDNAVSYERYDKKNRPDSIQARIILNDFVNLYGVRAYKSTKRMPCLVLKNCPVVNYIEKDAGGKMTYMGTTVLVSFLDYVNKFPPAVDEVNKDIKIRLGTYETLDDLNKQLAVYGIRGDVEEREIEVLLIEEVD
ncbi:Thiol-disulfide isomerase or thioredoxin [Sphingobacterium nematocida]|uniref:Thiol-disulfide isomerase or thioredoxin n=1 Tax=Sphingobacterium nematocida TaxID=1513896 RepID=A0A1T5FLQ9_9SPHI|nr:TlpA disulfide reductase family protein [Sphingobacterium nematocida]SKB97085.1 Thiol-disulfide isomerase or thioredoxin [Sphingobacterium nematocida]